MHKMVRGALAIVAGLAIALLGTLSAYRANAAEVKVLSTVAVKSALDDLSGKFEGETGNKVTVSYATAGEVVKRIQSGETVDMTILPKPPMDQLVQQGKVVPDSIVKFAPLTEFESRTGSRQGTPMECADLVLTPRLRRGERHQRRQKSRLHCRRHRRPQDRIRDEYLWEEAKWGNALKGSGVGIY